eukprot:235288_1
MYLSMIIAAIIHVVITNSSYPEHPSNILVPDILCSFRILSVDHAFGPSGMYFNFDVSTASCLLDLTGTSLTHGSIHHVIYFRDNSIDSSRSVMIWTQPNGGSNGDGHGRIHPYSSAAEGDWIAGERIAFYDLHSTSPTGCTCLCVPDLPCAPPTKKPTKKPTYKPTKKPTYNPNEYVLMAGFIGIREELLPNDADRICLDRFGTHLASIKTH